MLEFVRSRVKTLLLVAEGAFDHPFGPRWNPLRQLGTLSFFFYWICAVSGIYVYVLFETGVGGAYESVEYMTRQQWYLGGVMRSLHRYSADAMVVTTAFHILRELVTGRYRGVRWFTWFTGVPILWFLYMSGISGYWLVWDKLAQYVAIGSMEWLDWLGIFGEPLANNFLTPESLSDRFFSLLVFMHIFVPLILLFLMWIHLFRLNRPRINPPGGLAAGALLALVALALVKPALSHAPADLGTVPTVLRLDWFYMAAYPLFDSWGPGILWGLAFGASLLVAFLPWLPPLRRPPAARVVGEKCNGCTLCFEDCPFGAITMGERDDRRPGSQIAVVNADLCAGCGICVGACPISTPFSRTGGLVSGIELPALPLKALRRMTDAAVDRMAGSRPAGEAGVVVFGCDHGCAAETVEGDGVAAVRLPCIGMLPPSFVDYVLARGGADGVMLTGCREGDCYHRLGVEWTRQRMNGERDPFLSGRVARERIRLCWAAPIDGARLKQEVDAFRIHLKNLEPGPSPAHRPGATAPVPGRTPEPV